MSRIAPADSSITLTPQSAAVHTPAAIPLSGTVFDCGHRISMEQPTKWLDVAKAPIGMARISTMQVGYEVFAMTSVPYRRGNVVLTKRPGKRKRCTLGRCTERDRYCGYFLSKVFDGHHWRVLRICELRLAHAKTSYQDRSELDALCAQLVALIAERMGQPIQLKTKTTYTIAR